MNLISHKPSMKEIVYYTKIVSGSYLIKLADRKNAKYLFTLSRFFVRNFFFFLLSGETRQTMHSRHHAGTS